MAHRYAPPPNLDDMAYFAAVADGGGFGATSRALGISKATLSRRVARLEASLGADLLVRDEQRLYLTPLGAAFAGHCAAMLREARRAVSVVAPRTRELQGTLRVACPAALLGTTLAEPLRAFVAKHLRVSLLLIVSEKADDDAIDLALGVQPIDQHADARLLREEPSVLVAAPVLARELEAAITLQDLDGVPTLSAQAVEGSSPRRAVQWSLRRAGEAPDVWEHVPCLRCPDLRVIRDAAVQGLGVALLPEHACTTALRDGQLERVLTDWQGPTETLWLRFTRSHPPCALALALAEALGEQLATCQCL